MIIEIKRKYYEKFTAGRLFLNGVFECFTLEDPRQEFKIKHETCIPEGKYPVIINRSNRFNKLMPLICNVHNFSGVRIHTGNTVKDTSGCVLVGKQIDTELAYLYNSRFAYEALFSKLLKKHLNEEPIEINIYEEKI